MSKRSLLLAVLWFLLIFPLPGGAQNVARVLVVENDSSPTSTAVGNYYVAARAIPAGNVCHIQTQDSALSTTNEVIPYTSFLTQIRSPILSYISQHGLQIDYIVLTKGIPIRVSSDANGPLTQSGSTRTASVDSLLAISRGYPAQPDIQATDGNGHIVLVAWVNRYWNATQHFSHAAYPGFLVTRLDGYTLADAEALVDRAQQANVLAGNWVFDIDPGRGDSSHVQPRNLTDPDYNLNYGDYNRDMITAGQYLQANGVPDVLINDANFPPVGTFLGNISQIAGYVSWGSNDGHYNRALYNSLSFLPGSIAETAVSTSGRTLLDRNAPGQSLIADLISQGVTGCKGYVFEPFLDAIASPSVLFPHYTQGYNLAESFYAASRLIGWMDMVIGDPLTTVRVVRLKSGPKSPIGGPLNPPHHHTR